MPNEHGADWPLAADYGTGPEASWGPREVLAHVEEYLPFWLAEIAYASGYSDQAHFNREFRDMVGCTPSQFPFVQDMLTAA